MEYKNGISRKQFVKTGVAGLLGTGLLASCGKADNKGSESPNIITNKKYRWQMVTTWPPNFPVLGEACNKLAELIQKMSAGRMTIKVYGGGELIPALEAFDAVTSSAVEMGSGAAYYWAGKTPATQFFGAVPFGMNAQQLNSWILTGGGMELWRELYAKFNLVPFLGGNTGVQMGGWYNREINTPDDLKGLKMRMPGLGGQVLTKAGGTAVLVAGGEIYTNLERGVIDATEWIGPYHDYLMGFHNIAKYYYAPGWHEPATILEFFINKAKFDALPEDLRMIIEAATHQMNGWVLAEFEKQNAVYLQKIKEEGEVEVRFFPEEVLSALREHAKVVIQDVVDRDEFSKKVYDSYQAFQAQHAPWSALTEEAFYNLLTI